MVRLKYLSDAPIPNNGLRPQRRIMVAEYFELSNTIIVNCVSVRL